MSSDSIRAEIHTTEAQIADLEAAIYALMQLLEEKHKGREAFYLKKQAFLERLEKQRAKALAVGGYTAQSELARKYNENIQQSVSVETIVSKDQALESIYNTLGVEIRRDEDRLADLRADKTRLENHLSNLYIELDRALAREAEEARAAEEAAKNAGLA